MHIFQSSLKLVSAVTLSAHLTSALRHELPRPSVLQDAVRLSLYGTANLQEIVTNGEDIQATERIFETFAPVTLNGWDGVCWEIIEGWDGIGNAEAMPFYGDRAAWLEKVTRAFEASDNTVLAAGRDRQTPPVWWVIINENGD